MVVDFLCGGCGFHCGGGGFAFIYLFIIIIIIIIFGFRFCWRILVLLLRVWLSFGTGFFEVVSWLWWWLPWI